MSVHLNNRIQNLSAMRSRISSKKKNKGLTLVELLIIVAIFSVLLYGAWIGYTVYKNTQGQSEGESVSFALGCAATKVRAPSFAATTLSTLVNYDCFGDGSNVTGKGTTSGSATSKLTNTAYTIAAADLSGGTANGITIGVSPIDKRSCQGAVLSLDGASARIIVTPTGGAAATVKPVNGNIDDDLLGTACNSAATVTIDATAGR